MAVEEGGLYTTEVVVWNETEGRPATAEEVYSLVREGHLVVNYFIHGPEADSGRVWIEITDGLGYILRDPDLEDAS